MPADCDVSGDDRETVNILREQLRKAKAAAATLQEMARWQKSPKLTAKLGEINPRIYRTKPVAQRDILSRLPNEIQHMVWSHITDQPDRLMLALTCKWQAAVYEGLKVIPSEMLAKKRSPHTKAKSELPSKDAGKKSRTVVTTKAQRLAVLYRLGKTMKDEHPIIPKRLRLCYSCVRFIPRSYDAVCKSKGKVSRFGWGGKELNIDPSKLRSRDFNSHMIVGHHCPDCVARKAFETVNMTNDFKEWKKTLGRYGKV